MVSLPPNPATTSQGSEPARAHIKRVDPALTPNSQQTTLAVIGRKLRQEEGSMLEPLSQLAEQALKPEVPGTSLPSHSRCRGAAPVQFGHDSFKPWAPAAGLSKVHVAPDASGVSHLLPWRSLCVTTKRTQVYLFVPSPTCEASRPRRQWNCQGVPDVWFGRRVRSSRKFTLRQDADPGPAVGLVPGGLQSEGSGHFKQMEPGSDTWTG